MADRVSTEKQVQKQIEYYFGDVNLQRDRFLQDEMKKDHGWVPIDVLLTFNRLKILVNDDKEIIQTALKASELVDVSEDNAKLRRNPDFPMPENSLEFWKEIKTRTAYIKGFEPETTKLDDVLEYLKPYGHVSNIVMRRIKASRAFKGSVFATFDTVEEAEKFINAEEGKTFRDKEMIRMMQNDYWAKETAENKARKAQEKELKHKKAVEAILKEDNAHAQPVFLKGMVLIVKGLPKENVTYSMVKEFFGKFGKVAYAVLDEAAGEAQVRFDGTEENAAGKVIEKTKEGDAPLKFQDKELELSILEGEDEEKYWADFTKNKAVKFDRSKKFRQSHPRGHKRRGDRMENNENKRSRKGAKEAEGDGSAAAVAESETSKAAAGEPVAEAQTAES